MKNSKLKSCFKKFTEAAQKILTNKRATLSKIEEGMAKAVEHKVKLTTVWSKLQLFFGLAKDYANDNYKEISNTSVVAVVGGLLYFISPLDVIPDFILGLGFLDDAFIIGYVFNKVAKELDQYQKWKDSQKTIIHV